MPIRSATAMTVRDRFRAIMNFQPFDRLPIVEWATWWDLTIQRWRDEGLPADAVDGADIARHFGLDVYLQDWVPTCAPGCPGPKVHLGPIIESHDEYERIRPFLYPRPAVNAERWRRWAQAQARGEVALWFTLEGFFWFARGLLGAEPHLYALYDQPDLVHRINDDLATWHLQVIEEIAAIAVPDFMTFAEDMSYNHGPMLSGEQFDEFMLPCYRRVIPRLKELGTLAIIDSDGDVTRALPWFEKAGLDGVLPLERQAGVDIATLRAAHPTMRFIGHFDKMTMLAGPDAMEREFQRLLPTAARGGYLISCDHQTPPGVSYQRYQEYLKLFRDYAARAAR